MIFGNRFGFEKLDLLKTDRRLAGSLGSKFDQMKAAIYWITMRL